MTKYKMPCPTKFRGKYSLRMTLLHTSVLLISVKVQASLGEEASLTNSFEFDFYDNSTWNLCIMLDYSCILISNGVYSSTKVHFYELIHT